MRSGAAAAFLSIFISGASAHPAETPKIDIAVEQPVYTGMPVWLDVTVHDRCLEARYWGDLTAGTWPHHNFDPSLQYAEIIGPDNKIPRPGFIGDMRVGWRPSEPRHVCPGTNSTGTAREHRFPLHLVAQFSNPGIYKVRWVIPANDDDGVIAQSAWLNVTVVSSTPAQRESWLQAMLARLPADHAEVERDYVPSLVAAWDDPRVRRRLLDLLCDADESLSESAWNTFPGGMDLASQQYLIHLARTKGCATGGLRDYLSLHNPADDTMREALTDALAGQMIGADVGVLKQDIAALFWLENGQNSTAENNATLAVLRAAPMILASNDMSAKKIVAHYLSFRGDYPGSHEVLRELALQPNRVAEDALTSLVNFGDQTDLQVIHARLSGPLDGLIADNLAQIISGLARQYQRSPEYVHAAQATLRDLLQHATEPAIRDDAALALAKLGDHEGMTALVQALRIGSDRETSALLGQLTAADVACTGPQDACYEDATQAPNPCPCPTRLRKEMVINYFESRHRD